MDPRITRTRAALTEAIFDQIQRKRWDKITVQDLLDATGISRSTFYSHFDNKLDVLTANIPSVAGTIRFDRETERVDLTPLFLHVEEAAPVLHPIMSQPVLREVTDEFERKFAHAFSELVDDPTSPLPNFLAGALISTIRHYAMDRSRRPAEEMASRVGAHVDCLLRADSHVEDPTKPTSRQRLSRSARGIDSGDRPQRQGEQSA